MFLSLCEEVQPFSTAQNVCLLSTHTWPPYGCKGISHEGSSATSIAEGCLSGLLMPLPCPKTTLFLFPYLHPPPPYRDTDTLTQAARVSREADPPPSSTEPDWSNDNPLHLSVMTDLGIVM